MDAAAQVLPFSLLHHGFNHMSFTIVEEFVDVACFIVL